MLINGILKRAECFFCGNKGYFKYIGRGCKTVKICKICAKSYGSRIRVQEAVDNKIVSLHLYHFAGVKA